MFPDRSGYTKPSGRRPRLSGRSREAYRCGRTSFVLRSGDYRWTLPETGVDTYGFWTLTKIPSTTRSRLPPREIVPEPIKLWPAMKATKLPTSSRSNLWTPGVPPERFRGLLSPSDLKQLLCPRLLGAYTAMSSPAKRIAGVKDPFRDTPFTGRLCVQSRAGSKRFRWRTWQGQPNT